MLVPEKAVYPVYSFFLCLAALTSLCLSSFVALRTALICAGAALPVHFVALLWVCTPKVSAKDGAATIVDRMWKGADDLELQQQACRALLQLTARGADTGRKNAIAANERRGAEAIVAAMAKFADDHVLVMFAVEALLRLVAARKEQAAQLAPTVIPVVLSSLQACSDRSSIVGRLCVLAGRVLDSEQRLAISAPLAVDLVDAIVAGMARHHDDKVVSTHAVFALLVLAAADAPVRVKSAVASKALAHVSAAMKSFGRTEKLLASYGVVLVAATIRGAKQNWRPVLESGVLAQVAAAVDSHSDDTQISTFGPQLLALSKAQVEQGVDVVMMNTDNEDSEDGDAKQEEHSADTTNVHGREATSSLRQRRTTGK